MKISCSVLNNALNICRTIENISFIKIFMVEVTKAAFTAAKLYNDNYWKILLLVTKTKYQTRGNMRETILNT